MVKDGRSRWKAVAAEESRRRLRKKADPVRRSWKGRESEASKP